MENDTIDEKEEEELKKKFLARRETRKSIFQVSAKLDDLINTNIVDRASQHAEKDGDDRKEDEAEGGSFIVKPQEHAILLVLSPQSRILAPSPSPMPDSILVSPPKNFNCDSELRATKLTSNLYRIRVCCALYLPHSVIVIDVEGQI